LMKCLVSAVDVLADGRERKLRGMLQVDAPHLKIVFLQALLDRLQVPYTPAVVHSQQHSISAVHIAPFHGAFELGVEHIFERGRMAVLKTDFLVANSTALEERSHRERRSLADRGVGFFFDDDVHRTQCVDGGAIERNKSEDTLISNGLRRVFLRRQLQDALFDLCLAVSKCQSACIDVQSPNTHTHARTHTHAHTPGVD